MNRFGRLLSVGGLAMLVGCSDKTTETKIDGKEYAVGGYIRGLPLSSDIEGTNLYLKMKSGKEFIEAWGFSPSIQDVKKAYCALANELLDGDDDKVMIDSLSFGDDSYKIFRINVEGIWFTLLER